MTDDIIFSLTDHEQKFSPLSLDFSSVRKFLVSKSGHNVDHLIDYRT